MEQSFGSWLQEQLDEQGMSQADLCRASGLKSSVVSNIINGRRGVGQETCRKIARGLHISGFVVLRKAGFQIDDAPMNSEYSDTAAMLMQQLPEDDQREVVDFVRMKVQIAERKAKYKVVK